jgi:hypothetical protein
MTRANAECIKSRLVITKKCRCKELEGNMKFLVEITANAYRSKQARAGADVESVVFLLPDCAKVRLQRLPPSVTPLYQEPGWQLRSNYCERAFVPYPSTWRPRLVSIYPRVQASSRCWDQRHHHAISYDTCFFVRPGISAVISNQFLPSAFVPHPSTCCLCKDVNSALAR